ncbi:hypothetical protein APA74_10690 [Pseudomonas aeruginosa]|nr:hypothetical protein APA74_10690 [Pseudomonas aeruginosa]
MAPSRTWRHGSQLSRRSKRDLMESMEAEFSLTKDQRECIEQLSRFLREGIGKLTALSERVADGDIVVLC